MASHSPERREPMDLLEGMVINGKFRVGAVVASGGMGRIYRAEQAPLGRLVAVKVLRTPTTGSDTVATEFRKRFFREASILAKLQHANVVTLFDYGRIEGLADERYFMAMEYLAGDTLTQRLKDRGCLPVQESLRILRQIARGLREAHKLGAVHRDLKPSNVMLVPEDDGAEVVKILDFGIGKLMDDGDQEITQEGAFLGSPKYIAPEQVNERRVDARTDVYALGVIAFECLTGVVPFTGETNLETILAHTNRPLPRMAERVPGAVVPELVEAFVRRCLEKEPAGRPQSMEEVLREISECERRLFGATSLGALHDDRSPPSTARMPHPFHEAATLAMQPTDPAAVRPARPSVGTASPLTRSEIPPPRPASPSRVPLVVFGVVVTLAAAGVVAVRFLPRDRGARTAISAAAGSAAVAPVRSFTLVLDSKPPGADVWDGEEVIGTTPMQVTIDRAGVKDSQRHFVLRLDGYAPYTVLQGDSEGIVQVTAPLDPLPASPSATASPAAPRRAPARPPPARPGGTATQAPKQDTDIKLQR